jgi:16S rRNA (guanine527-N7)-methyltransferase
VCAGSVSESSPVTLPPPPPAALAVFGDRRPLAISYGQLLTTDGIGHGLLGPREAERVWDRHLINCAVLSELLPADARVVDVGSGAGLPGLALACARADLRLQLVEPLERRFRFLLAAVAHLGLEAQVTVIRGRAEDPTVAEQAGNAMFVTSRAVAPLDRLAGWCRPLLAPGGRLLAMKGARAAVEIATHRGTLARIGMPVLELVHCGERVLDEPVRVVVLERSGSSAQTRNTRRRSDR